jgi:hypothetical protein
MAVKPIVTVPSMPVDGQCMVCRWEGQDPYATRTLYGCTHIRIQWPALVEAQRYGYGCDEQDQCIQDVSEGMCSDQSGI